MKYPEVEVQLTNMDGNGFMIVSRVQRALKRAGVPQREIEKFRDEATSDTYEHLLSTVQEWVTAK